MKLLDPLLKMVYFHSRCSMEGEKLAEFISHTQADPVLAKHVLQSKCETTLWCSGITCFIPLEYSLQPFGEFLSTSFQMKTNHQVHLELQWKIVDFFVYI